MSYSARVLFEENPSTQFKCLNKSELIDIKCIALNENEESSLIKLILFLRTVICPSYKCCKGYSTESDADTECPAGTL